MRLLPVAAVLAATLGPGLASAQYLVGELSFGYAGR